MKRREKKQTIRKTEEPCTLAMFPNILIKDFETFLRELSASLVAYGKNHIVVGDFNAKSKLWGSRVDRRGELLLD